MQVERRLELLARVGVEALALVREERRELDERRRVVVAAAARDRRARREQPAPAERREEGARRGRPSFCPNCLVPLYCWRHLDWLVSF